MQFEKGHLYHIYNQGNNRQRIFFERENYLFFLRKMRIYLLPYCNIIAYCLMPNHFHWIVEVTNTTVGVAEDSEGVTSSNALTKATKQRTFNDSIGLLIRSYSRAINNQNNTSGSLFRKQTKAECLTEINGITPSFYNTKSGTLINIDNPEIEYPQVCFDYIHQNPVNASLVANAEDWEFSSFRDYAGLRDGTLINRDVAKEYIDF